MGFELVSQQESPSAEMVMLERLFLQAERYALAEDRRRARRDPGQCHSRRKEASLPITVTIIKLKLAVYMCVCVFVFAKMRLPALK